MLGFIVKILFIFVIVFCYLVFWILFLDYHKTTNENLKDIEIELANLEVENIKLKNEIEIILETLKIKT